MSKKLNGSVNLLADSFRSVIDEALTEALADSREKSKQDMKDMETSLLSAVSHDLEKFDERITDRMNSLDRNVQAQINELRKEVKADIANIATH